MTFQSAVRYDQGYGVVGEFVFDGPRRAEPGILRTTAPANNVFGRAFTLDSALPGVWRAGDPTSNGERIAIMVSPKEHASGGTQAGGPLAPTLVLPNEVNATFATMGQILVQSTVPTNLVGNVVRFILATGELLSVPPGTALDPLHKEIPGAVVVRVPQPTDDGLMVIQLTTQ